MSTTYHKINGIFKRDERGRFIDGEWSQDEFGYLADLPWRFTEKVDGTNIRLTYDGGFFRGNEHRFVGGRTDNAQIPPKLLAACVELMKAAPFEEVFPDTTTDPDSPPVVLYGEGYGAGIQKGGGLYRPDNSFVLFDVRVGRFWLKREAVEDIGARLGIETVQQVLQGYTLNQAIEAIRAQATTEAQPVLSAWYGVTPEGVVAVPEADLLARNGMRIITKIKLRDFQ